MPDPADRAQIIIEQEDEIRRMQREAVKSAAIISHDECIECGCDIPEARRIALPGVSLCIHCQSVAEMVR